MRTRRPVTTRHKAEASASHEATTPYRAAGHFPVALVRYRTTSSSGFALPQMKIFEDASIY